MFSTKKGATPTVETCKTAVSVSVWTVISSAISPTSTTILWYTSSTVLSRTPRTWALFFFRLPPKKTKKKRKWKEKRKKTKIKKVDEQDRNKKFGKFRNKRNTCNHYLSHVLLFTLNYLCKQNSKYIMWHQWNKYWWC